MTDETLTVPCEGIGVWEGAAVIHGVPGLDYYADRRGVVTQRHHAEWTVWLTPDGDWPETVITANERGMRLDLTHRQTRLEAMVRLAHGLGLCEASSATWERRGPQVWAVATTWGPDADTYWCQQYSAGSDWCSSQPVRTVGALSDVNPTDDTRLPDGTRVADVRALARVLRHVFSTKVESQCRT